MADFTEMLFELLPLHSNLQKPNNQLRKVLDGTVGEWFDNYNFTADNFDINTATGGYLDLFGADYGIPRKLNESDEDYRSRLIQEKLDHLTPETLRVLYDLPLYVFVDEFDAYKNILTSDNDYIAGRKMGFADETMQQLLKNKFIIDGSVTFINDDGTIDYIYNINDEDILLKNIEIYDYPMLQIGKFFKGDTSIKKLNLHLSQVGMGTSAVFVQGEFYQGFAGCTGLTDLRLIADGISWVYEMCSGCTNLKNVELYLPSLNPNVYPDHYDEQTHSWVYNYSYKNIFLNCSNLESIILTVPNSIKSNFKAYVLNLNLSNLDTFIINGEEVDLS